MLISPKTTENIKCFVFKNLVAFVSWQIAFLEVVFVRLSESHCPRFERLEH